tara:strand:+ start:38 stop:214 length:177 start_codon:yes stop_codon:yes gene_type:complete
MCKTINTNTIIMNIDIKSKDSLFIDLNGWTYYIDDSTGEQIVEKWRATSMGKLINKTQ